MLSWQAIFLTFHNKSITMILLLLFVLAFALVDAYVHMRLIRSGKQINHKKAWLVRAIPITLFFAINFSSMHEFAGILIASCGLFWLVFDIALNVFRGLPIDYIPISGENISVTDTLFTNFWDKVVTQAFIISTGLWIAISPEKTFIIAAHIYIHMAWLLLKNDKILEIVRFNFIPSTIFIGLLSVYTSYTFITMRSGPEPEWFDFWSIGAFIIAAGTFFGWIYYLLRD